MREVMVGSDRVVVEDKSVSIYAPAMESWRVSRHRRPAVHFEGVRYQLIAREPIGPQITRYQLVPWTDTGLASEEILYDEEYVRLRDETTRERAVQTRKGFALLLLYPILGFLWSTTRARLRERYGLGRRSHAVAFFLQSAAVCLIGTWVLTVFISPAWWLVAIVLAVDLAIRWFSSLREDVMDPYGAFEWAFRRL